MYGCRSEGDIVMQTSPSYDVNVHTTKLTVEDQVYEETECDAQAYYEVPLRSATKAKL